jgi:hypothetical protein
VYVLLIVSPSCMFCWLLCLRVCAVDCSTFVYILLIVSTRRWNNQRNIHEGRAINRTDTKAKQSIEHTRRWSNQQNIHEGETINRIYTKVEQSTAQTRRQSNQQNIRAVSMLLFVSCLGLLFVSCLLCCLCRVCCVVCAVSILLGFSPCLF